MGIIYSPLGFDFNSILSGRTASGTRMHSPITKLLAEMVAMTSSHPNLSDPDLVLAVVRIWPIPPPAYEAPHWARKPYRE
jgi:hypothetical protein